MDCYKQLYLKAFNSLTEITELIIQKQSELEEMYLSLMDDNESLSPRHEIEKAP